MINRNAVYRAKGKTTDNRWRYVIFSGLVAVTSLWLSGGVRASMWPEHPLWQRVLRSGGVVVGKLVNVERNAIIIEHKNYKRGRRNLKRLLVHLDTGEIRTSRIIFSYMGSLTRGPRDQTIRLPFACHSQEQPQGEGSSMVSSSYLNFEEGQEGIWLLDHEVFVGHTAISNPFNFMPIDSLEALVAAAETALDYLKSRP